MASARWPNSSMRASNAEAAASMASSDNPRASWATAAETGRRARAAARERALIMAGLLKDPRKIRRTPSGLK